MDSTKSLDNVQHAQVTAKIVMVLDQLVSFAMQPTQLLLMLLVLLHVFNAKLMNAINAVQIMFAALVKLDSNYRAQFVVLVEIKL